MKENRKKEKVKENKKYFNLINFFDTFLFFLYYSKIK